MHALFLSAIQRATSLPTPPTTWTAAGVKAVAAATGDNSTRAAPRSRSGVPRP